MDSAVHGILQVRILEWVAVPSPGDLPNLGVEPGLPHCWRILYQLKPKNIGVGSLSLLQKIFPTQDLGSPALQADSLPTELSGKQLST